MTNHKACVQRRSGAHARHELGNVMLVAMVTLLMLTLIAVGVVRLSTRHTQVVNNEQVRTESVAAANYALDMVINEPATTWTDLKTAAGRVMYVNLGTQTTDDKAENSIGVTVKNMTCRRARLIKNAELLKTSGGTTYVDTADVSCFGGSSGTGLSIVDPSAPGVASGNSNCATVLYEVEANASDTKLLNATARVVQGVEVRTDITALAAGGCP
jgi:Tfp pilus assembly protein PilX